LPKLEVEFDENEEKHEEAAQKNSNNLELNKRKNSKKIQLKNDNFNHPSKEKIPEIVLNDNQSKRKKQHSQCSDKESCSLSKKKKMQRLCHFTNRVKEFKEDKNFDSESSSLSVVSEKKDKQCLINPIKINMPSFENFNPSIPPLEKLQSFNKNKGEISNKSRTSSNKINLESTIRCQKQNNCFKISLLENPEEQKTTSPRYSKNSDSSETNEKIRYMELKENLNKESNKTKLGKIKPNKNNNLEKERKKVKEDISMLKLKREKSKNRQNINKEIYLQPYHEIPSFNKINSANDFIGMDDKSTTANTKSNYAMSHNYGATFSNIDKSDVNFFIENFTYNDLFNSLNPTMNLPNLLKNMDNETPNECFSLSSLRDKDLGVFGQSSNIFDFSGEISNHSNLHSNDPLKCLSLTSNKSDNERRNTNSGIEYSYVDSGNSINNSNAKSNT